MGPETISYTLCHQNSTSYLQLLNMDDSVMEIHALKGGFQMDLKEV